MELRISADLALPLQVATEAIADYGIRDSGKTHDAAVLAEEVIRAGVQVVVVDPTDVWWGLRSSADGQGDGLPVYVFGGSHADIPLEEAAGELIADVVVDSGINAVLSLRHLRKAAQHRFFTAFAERLYHRKGEPDRRSTLHLVVDEAHQFAPQQVLRDTARMVGAIEDIVRLGRSSGFGVTLISQRPASVNNNVRTQCSVLVCHRVMSPHDRDALDRWIEAWDAEGQRAEFMGSLASLKTGEAWVWAPRLDIFQRVAFRARDTFDSSATPKPGQARVEPKRFTAVDVEALGEQIAAAVQRAHESDPRTLQRRVQELGRDVARLERELAAAREAPAQTMVDRVEVPVLDADDRLLLALTHSGVTDLRESLERLNIADLATTLVRLNNSLTRVEVRIDRAGVAQQEEQPLRKRPVAGSPRRQAHLTVQAPPGSSSKNLRAPAMPAPSPSTGEGGGGGVNGGGKYSADIPRALPAGARRMLATLATFPGRPLTRQQLGTLAGVSARGGTFGDYLSRLRVVGLIYEPSPGEVEATAPGLNAAEAPPIETTKQLLDLYRARFPLGARRMLDVLVESYPHRLSRAELGERAQVSAAGGTFGDYLSRLRVVGLLDESDGVRLGDTVFMFESFDGAQGREGR